MRWLPVAALVTLLYHRPVGMLAVYLHDRYDFPRQRASVYAAIEEGARGR